MKITPKDFFKMELELFKEEGANHSPRIDVFMKYFKDGYISSSLLNPDKFPVSLKWFKYTFAKNNVFEWQLVQF